MKAGLIPTWLQEFEREAGYTKRRFNMSAGLTIKFMKWGWEWYIGGGEGKFTIAELSGTILGAKVAAFVKVG